MKLKCMNDFNAVIDYLTTVGFKDKKEMETYLKKKGFGVKFQNLYSDSENNHIMFKVEFYGDKVFSMEVIKLPITIEFMKEVSSYGNPHIRFF